MKMSVHVSANVSVSECEADWSLRQCESLDVD